MAMRGPEERERFAQHEEIAGPPSSPRLRQEQAKATKVVLGGSVAEALCGAATVVLAIFGLTRPLQGSLASIATIVFGIALIAPGGAISARLRELSRGPAAEDEGARAEIRGGAGAELFGGAAGIVLGILGLLGLLTTVLIPVAIMIYGGTLLLSSNAIADLGVIGPRAEQDSLAQAARQAALAASGMQTLIGAGVAVLGLLALVGLAPFVLTQVALLALGSSVVLSGAAVSGRMAPALRR